MREATSLGRKPASANNYAVPSRANSGLENTSLTTSSQIHSPEKDFHAKRWQKSKEQVGKYRRGKGRCQISTSLHILSHAEQEMKTRIVNNPF